MQYIIIGLVILSGLTVLPLIKLRQYAELKLKGQWGGSWYVVKWNIAQYVALILSAPVVIWYIPVFMASFVPGFLGFDWDEVTEKYPPIEWVLLPFIPLIGIPLWFTALIIRGFWTPPGLPISDTNYATTEG